jgi:hypothetical protein
LAALLRNFFAATRSDAPTDEEGRPTAPLRVGASTGPKNGQNETLISPGETKRFAGRVVSHWNHYGRRIRHFAGLFVFNDLSPFSFRRFRSMLF